MQVLQELKGGRGIAGVITQLFQYESSPGNIICKFLGLGSRIWKKIAGRKLECHNKDVREIEGSFKQQLHGSLHCSKNLA